MSTRILAEGKQDNVAAYRTFLAAVVEHWDKFTRVRSGYDDKRQRAGGLSKQDFEAALKSDTPNTDWSFELLTDDEEFAVWFRMRYF